MRIRLNHERSTRAATVRKRGSVHRGNPTSFKVSDTLSSHSPLDQTGPHIEALALISRMLNDNTFHGALKNATSSQEVYELFAQRETQSAK